MARLNFQLCSTRTYFLTRPRPKFRLCRVLFFGHATNYFSTMPHSAFDKSTNYFSTMPQAFRPLFRTCSDLFFGHTSFLFWPRHDPLLSMPRLIFYAALIYFLITPPLFLNLTVFFNHVVIFFSIKPRLIFCL